MKQCKGCVYKEYTKDMNATTPWCTKHKKIAEHGCFDYLTKEDCSKVIEFMKIKYIKE